MSVFPDLEPARRQVERLLVDACVITRNPAGLSDAVLDQDTGALADPTPGREVYAGRCSVRPRAAGGVQEEAGAQFVATSYQLTLPLDAAVPVKGDVVTVTAAPRDAALVGRIFVVREVLLSTTAISRRCVVEARQ